VLVLGDDHWKQGIIGIVASRITERYGRPSILLSFDGADPDNPSPSDLGKGSGRSVKGINLVEALGACEDLLVKFGGHELAAGLTVRRDKLDEFRVRINEYAAKLLPSGRVKAQLEADMELAPTSVTVPFAEELSRLEPFGVGNPVPRFILSDMTLERVSELGGGKHLKLQVGRDGVSLCAMLFSTTREQFPYCEGDRIDLLGTVDVNEFRDIRTVQMVLQDIRPAVSAAKREREQIERYRTVRAGAALLPGEDMIPSHDDCARVYVLLRREFRRGRDTFSIRALLAMLSGTDAPPITYGKLKYILEIFHELLICGVTECESDVYRFDIFFNASKTNIEKSAILRKLKSQATKGD
jgi:single-stranded-DNA-specific exonuclease